MKPKIVFKLSAVIDKLQLEIKDASAGQSEIGADLILQIASKAHRAEDEIINLICAVDKCTKEEAEDVDFIAFIKRLMSESGFLGFFNTAAGLKDLD